MYAPSQGLPEGQERACKSCLKDYTRLRQKGLILSYIAPTKMGLKRNEKTLRTLMEPRLRAAEQKAAPKTHKYTRTYYIGK